MKATCPHCRAVNQMPDKSVGKRVSCFTCGGVFVCHPDVERLPDISDLDAPSQPASAAVSRGPRPQPPAQPVMRQRQAPSRWPVILAAIIGLPVLFCCGAPLFFLGIVHNAPRQDRPTEPVRQGGLSNGSPCVITMGNDNFVLLGADESSYGEAMSAAHKNNMGAVRQLITAGRAFLVPARTRATVIDAGILTHRVRIADGEVFAGHEGVVACEWVRKTR